MLINSCVMLLRYVYVFKVHSNSILAVVQIQKEAIFQALPCQSAKIRGSQAEWKRTRSRKKKKGKAILHSVYCIFYEEDSLIILIWDLPEIFSVYAPED